MTIDELDRILQRQGYHVDREFSSRWWMVFDHHQHVIAKISKQTQYLFTVQHSVLPGLVSKGFLHFAATPICERIADCEVELELSQTDVDLLAQLPLDQTNNDGTVQLPASYLHALRRLRNQLHRVTIVKDKSQKKD